MSATTDYKWITEGPDFAFTDDERWEITDTGDGFTLRENTTHDDPDPALSPHWEPTDKTFGSMDDAKAHADKTAGRVGQNLDSWKITASSGDYTERAEDLMAALTQFISTHPDDFVHAVVIDLTD
jgi:hypothetical protein